MRILPAAVIVLLLALATPPAVAEARRAAILTDGRSDTKPAPLIIALHGFTGTGASLRRKTHFDALARQHGFSVAYPSGPARRWDDNSAGSADVAYLTALITALVAQGRADPARIFVVGHSNGGALALRMSCVQPRLIRAIGVVAMNAPRTPHCRGAAPMAAAFIHGAVDPIVPATGLLPTRYHGGFVSTAKTLKQWSTRNRCGLPPPIQRFNQTGGETTAEFIQYRNCAAPLLHIRLTGHGHEWPGAGPRATWLQGPASRELDAASALWRFFSTLR